MPNSITKNKKDKQIIDRMFQKAFPDKEMKEYKELTEGFFNVAYSISMTDGTQVILKIAPSAEMDVMTHEVNIMFSEVDSMRRVAKETSVPVAEIMLYDNSHTIIDSDYFFMKKLVGSSYSSCKEEMTEEQKNHISFMMGKYTAGINSVKGNRFGYYGQAEKQGDSWFEVFKSIIKDTIDDAARKSIDQKVSHDMLLELLDRDRSYFEQVTEPKLVHWDIWDGNVFIHEGKITGLIDFERCLWGDELMEVGFRTMWSNKVFFDGYGIGELTPEQLRRAKWYDIYFFLIVSLEYGYRHYDDNGSYEWGTGMLKQLLEEMALIR